MDNRWAMLCRLRVEAFNDPDWTWERKLDGDRMSVLVTDNGTTSLLARSGASKTDQFPEIRLDLPPESRPAMFDGEVVSAQGLGFQEFNQRRMNRQRDIESFARELPAMYVAFDCLMVGGRDIGHLPLAERRRALEAALPASMDIGPVRVPAQFRDGVALFEKANELKWEGVVGKRLDEPYMPHRRNWVKVKRWLEGTFNCVGYTLGCGRRERLFGALVVQSDDGKLKAEVGTGFDDATLASLLEYMRGRSKSMILAGGAMPAPVGVWVEPFRVRVKYVEVTNAGSLRFPVYLGRDAS